MPPPSTSDPSSNVSSTLNVSLCRCIVFSLDRVSLNRPLALGINLISVRVLSCLVIVYINLWTVVAQDKLVHWSSTSMLPTFTVRNLVVIYWKWVCFIQEGLRDSNPHLSTQHTTDPEDSRNLGNPTQSGSGDGTNPGENARSSPRAEVKPPSVDNANASTPRLAFEGLARLTNAIQDLAKERRKNILVEESELREKMRIARETIEVGRSKLEDFNRVLHTWVENLPVAQTAHGRALALRRRPRI